MKLVRITPKIIAHI